MTKLRAPISIDTALARIAGQVDGGWDAMAVHVGYQPRTVRAWGDPDRSEQPPLTACVALGILYRQQGGLGDPLLQAHADMVGAADAIAFADSHELRRETIGFLRESNEASIALFEAAEPDADEADRAVALREVMELRDDAERIALRLGGRPRAPP